MKRFVYALVPGIVAHELVHAAVGRGIGGEVSIDWSVPEVQLSVEDFRPPDVLLANLAPSLIGLPLLGAFVLALAELSGPLSVVEVLALYWLAINLFAFALPSPSDILESVRTVAYVRAQRREETVPNT